jgi:hypothetical protein
VRLTKAVGPAVVELLSAREAGKPPTDDEIRRAALSAIQGIDDDALEALTEAFGESSRVFLDAKRSPFLSSAEARESAFGGGEFGRYFGWLAFAIEVNFGGFFGSLGALLGRAPAAETRP